MQHCDPHERAGNARTGRSECASKPNEPSVVRTPVASVDAALRNTDPFGEAKRVAVGRQAFSQKQLRLGVPVQSAVVAVHGSVAGSVTSGSEIAFTLSVPNGAYSTLSFGQGPICTATKWLGWGRTTFRAGKEAVSTIYCAGRSRLYSPFYRTGSRLRNDCDEPQPIQTPPTPCGILLLLFLELF